MPHQASDAGANRTGPKTPGCTAQRGRLAIGRPPRRISASTTRVRADDVIMSLNRRHILVPCYAPASSVHTHPISCARYRLDMGCWPGEVMIIGVHRARGWHPLITCRGITTAGLQSSLTSYQRGPFFSAIAAFCDASCSPRWKDSPLDSPPALCRRITSPAGSATHNQRVGRQPSSAE